MEEELRFKISGCDPSKLIEYFSHPKILPKLFKNFTTIEILDETNYIAEFHMKIGGIPFTVRYKQTVIKGINAVYHEGVSDRPRAWWRFILEVTNYDEAVRTGECEVRLRGEYKGPLERLAHGPMRDFLENVKSTIQESKAYLFGV